MAFSASRFHAPEAQLPPFESCAAAKTFLTTVEGCLRSGTMDEAAAENIDRYFAESGLPKDYDRLALVAYAPGLRRILVVRRKRPPFEQVSSVIARLLEYARLPEMVRAGLRLQLDFIEEPPQRVDYRALGMEQWGARHFEIGVDGLMWTGEDGASHFFLPGDAYVRSLMSMPQLRAYLERTQGTEYLARARFRRFRSRSFISFQGEWLRLYRGHPVAGTVGRADLEKALDLSIRHIRAMQDDDGRFLYYYDAAKDSCRDHEHPKRDPQTNPYYNILRHAGGALTCVFHENLRRRGDTITTIQRALDFLVENSCDYNLEEKPASYVYYNRKAKLGGTGIALYLACEYRRLTGDDAYWEWTKRLARHVQGEILPSGEFRYYHIYLGQPVTADENDRYFSFYYPGEAVCGLARYYPLAEAEEQAQLREKLERALHFLLAVRPGTRSEHYTKVPSDSWLMMGINALWEQDCFRRAEYAEFVFGDADRMVAQMYHVLDAPYPDYAGAFYYEFGDYPYADGARCEGLLGAFELATQTGDLERARRYWQALKLAAWAVYHLVNTEASTYSVPNPQLSLGGIRFKYTRQWFRIDTIQHVASFYAKMLPYWSMMEDEGDA